MVADADRPDAGWSHKTFALAALNFIKEQQRERTEAKIAKPSTTRRDARLLRAGTPRRTAMGSSEEACP